MYKDYKNGTATFVIPHWRTENDLSRKHLDETIQGIMNQTDDNWNIVLVDDDSPCKEAKDYLETIKARNPEKIHVIYCEENKGPGHARNCGIEFAYKNGSPIVLFNDADDISNPKRLENVRKKFIENDDVNVVYSTFKVIDENSNLVEESKLSPAIYETLEGHTRDIVEGENAWIAIATDKNYTNLTSATAVRTDLAYMEPFPLVKASEDANTWLRYAAHKGQFIYDATIPSLYRIPQNTECSTRARLNNFYEVKANVDSDGFFKAMEIALENKNIDYSQCNSLKVKFYVKLAESLLNGKQKELAKEQINKAMLISRDETSELLGQKEELKILC